MAAGWESLVLLGEAGLGTSTHVLPVRIVELLRLPWERIVLAHVVHRVLLVAHSLAVLLLVAR